MRFVEVKEDPRKIRRDPKRYSNTVRNNLAAFLNDFMDSGIKFARVEIAPDEYANNVRAYNSLSHAADIYVYPIKVIYRRENIYLIRTDI